VANDRARRWSSYQPNVTGRGIVAGYSGRFWMLVVALGLAAGVGASALMGLLRLAQHLAYGYHSGPFLIGAEAAPGWRRVAALVAAAGVVGLGVVVLRRLPSAGGTEVSDALWLRQGRMAILPSIGRALVSIITVGMGVSLGREAAPQLTGAAVASRLADWAELPLWQRRLLVASGAGAGFAAVYNVPLGGALFALEVLLGTLALPLVLPALAVSVIATAIAWITLGTAHTYYMPTYSLEAGQMVWAALAGPIIGFAAVGWVRLVARVSRLRPRGSGRFIAPLVVFTVLGLVSIQYPQLLGNGKGIVQLALVGGISLGLFAILLVLKPLATAGCLGAGAPGGLFTPTLTVGVLLTGVLAGVWSHIWSHTHPASYALIGGGAFLAAAMQGPLSGVVLVLELTRHFDLLMAPTLVAVTEATVVARRLGAPSIYSARIRPDHESPTAAQAAAIEALDTQTTPAPGETDVPDP
jgi:CIC family chloride channel protein